MKIPNPPLSILLSLPFLALVFGSPNHEISGGGRRVLLNFKENPHGNNVTFDCSPKGHCVACHHSEKNDENYRCSETGYRMRFHCLEMKDGSDGLEETKSDEGRRDSEVSEYSKEVMHDAEQIVDSAGKKMLLDDDSSGSEGGSQGYMTYTSCIPAVNDQKLSVLGFEGMMVFMLIVSATFIYFRKFNSAASGAPIRIPTSFRF